MKPLCLLITLLGSCLLPMLAQAAPKSLADATQMFDQMDREDMFEALEKASNCLSDDKFQCAKDQLAIAERLVNGAADQKVWTAVRDDYNAARQRQIDEANEEKRLVAEQRQAERDERDRQERRAERQEQKRQEAYAVGSAMMAGQTYLTPQQRQKLIDAYVASSMSGTGDTSAIYGAGNEISGEIQRNTERKRERAVQAQEQHERTRQNLEQQRAESQRSRETSRAQLQAAQAEQRAKRPEPGTSAKVEVAKAEPAKAAPVKPASQPVASAPASKAAEAPRATLASAKPEPAKPAAAEQKPVKPVEPAFQQQLRPLGTTTNSAGDECRSWVNPSYPVSMEACSYRNGGSGYVRVVNNGNTAADVCWSVVYGTGGKERGCFIKMGPGEVTQPSCFSCGNNNKGKGVRQVQLEKYQPVK